MPPELTDTQLQKKQSKAQKRKAKRKAREARKLQEFQEMLDNAKKNPANSGLSRKDQILLGIIREEDEFDRIEDEYWADIDAHTNPLEPADKKLRNEQRKAKKTAARKARKLEEPQQNNPSSSKRLFKHNRARPMDRLSWHARPRRVLVHQNGTTSIMGVLPSTSSSFTERGNARRRRG